MNPDYWLPLAAGASSCNHLQTILNFGGDGGRDVLWIDGSMPAAAAGAAYSAAPSPPPTPLMHMLVMLIRPRTRRRFGAPLPLSA